MAAVYIRRARKSAELSQEELAKMLGVSPSRISDLENCRRRRATGEYQAVPLAFLYEIQHVTGVPLKILAGELPPDEQQLPGLPKRRRKKNLGRRGSHLTPVA